MDSFIKQTVKKNKMWRELIRQHKRYFIWEDNVPHWNKLIPQDKPSIMFFKSNETNRGCVLIIPGGCYLYESCNESVNIAEKITNSGINAAILDYRLFPYAKSTILSDGKRAIKYLRYYADDFDINKDKISVIGFSAGGNLATLCALNQDKENLKKKDKIDAQSSKINALGLGYPAVYLNEKYMNFDNEHARKYFRIDITKRPKDFPPTFIWHSIQDTVVDCNVSIEFAKKLAEYKIPVEMHLFPYGMHGQGLANTTKGEINEGDNKLTSCWSDLYIRWLNFYGF